MRLAALRLRAMLVIAIEAYRAFRSTIGQVDNSPDGGIRVRNGDSMNTDLRWSEPARCRSAAGSRLLRFWELSSCK